MFLAALILGGFAVAGVGLVAITHEATDARIAANRRAAMLATLRTVLPAAAIGNDPLADAIEVADPDLLGAPSTPIYRVRDAEGRPVALVLRAVAPDGYSGPITLLVAVLADGRLGGVRVLEHHETPGLGDKIEARRSDWIERSFTHRAIGDPPAAGWAVRADGGLFDQFTGATITPRAVVGAVHRVLRFVAREQNRLYDQPAAGAT